MSALCRLKGMPDDFPAVATFGIKDMERGEARARAELASGAVVHLVCKRPGPRGGGPRHRAWITPECDPGYEVKRVPTVNEFLKNMSRLLDRVEDEGIVFEVWDAVKDVRAYYVGWCPPEVAGPPARGSPVLRAEQDRAALLREFTSVTATTARPAHDGQGHAHQDPFREPRGRSTRRPWPPSSRP